MKTFVHTILTVSLLSATITTDAGGIGDKVGDWFDDQNYSNVTQPGVYEGQTARYATLGGYSMRAEISQPIQLLTVQTPKFSAGCGGIDMFTGGFAAIDADQFVEQLRKIGQNAKSLAFMLAIQVVSPQLSGVMEDIQDFANKYLTMDMDSCEAAIGLMGGAMEQMGVDKSNCILSRMNSAGETYGEAQAACTGQGGNRLNSAAPDGDRNVADFVEGNIAWYVLMQDPYFRADQKFAELVMNITGALILNPAPGTSSDRGIEPQTISPALTSDSSTERFDNIINALLYGSDSGSSLELYQCVNATTDKKSCTEVTADLQTVNVSWTGIYQKVDNLMAGIIGDIRSDSSLSAEELGVISSTNIPVYRFLTAATTKFARDRDVQSQIQQYTLLIANDIVLNAIGAVIERTEAVSGNLKGGLSDSSRIKAYREQLRGVMEGIHDRIKTNEDKAMQLIEMQQRIYAYEKAILPRLGPELASSAMWGN